MSQHDSYSDELLRGVLTTTKTIAIVGASPKPDRPSHDVMKYLIARGYDVYPVNPGHSGREIAGRMTYATLKDVPVAIDMVDIFRASDAVPQVVDEALALASKPKTIWMQMGVRNEQAAKKAENAGLTVIMDRCPKIELHLLL